MEPLTYILFSVCLGLVCLGLGIYIGQRILKDKLIRASEERAVLIVEHWIQKIQDQKLKNTIDGSYDVQIIEWCIEQAIADEDYEEADRLQKILNDMKGFGGGAT